MSFGIMIYLYCFITFEHILHPISLLSALIKFKKIYIKDYLDSMT